MTDSGAEFKAIDLSMMNKKLFFPLSGLGFFTVQTLLYPLILLRVRLQLQQERRLYRGLTHAAMSIIREEGFRGLYSGYFVKSAQFISAIFYSSTYETVRHAATALPSLSSSQRSFLGGAAASLVAQTLVVPIDIIAQHLMAFGRPLTPSSRPSVSPVSHARSLSPISLSPSELSSSWARFRAITTHIAKMHGIRGFYNGFFVSVCTVVPSSALWWAFYDKFCRLIDSAGRNFLRPQSLHSHSTVGVDSNAIIVDPSPSQQYGLPRLVVQLLASPLAGMLTAVIINPIDCVRVHVQVDHSSFRRCVHALWATEGIRWFTKGLSARLLHTSIFSFWLVLVYEPVKVLCLKDEFRGHFAFKYW